MTKSFSDNSLNSLLKREEFSTSEVTEQNELPNIALERVLMNYFHYMRFNNQTKNVTVNRAFRREKSKQQQREVNIENEIDSDKMKKD